MNILSAARCSRASRALARHSPLRRRRLYRWLLGAAAAGAALVAAALALHWYHLKRFSVIATGAAYRSGQPTEWGLWWLSRRHKVKTVLSLRPDNPRLHRGLLDPGEPDGAGETEYLARLGLNQVQWPMADEACWPWFTPWQYEEFFRLFDDPANLPVAIHCVGGRHRTGTAAALYRLEYDRWPLERVLPELLAFKYGTPMPLFEVNLRTYRPRPLPQPAQWRALSAHFAPLFNPAPASYAELVLRLDRAGRDHAIVDRQRAYLEHDGPFALCLAHRLVDSTDHPLAGLAAARAAACLESAEASDDDWHAAASLIADFGTLDQQARLLAIFTGENTTGPPSRRYHAAVTGVSNRYTANRLAYLQPLLDDRRPWPEPPACRYRYCDVAVGRLAAIADIDFMDLTDNWKLGLARARKWFRQHPAEARLRRLVPPTGKNPVLTTARTNGENLHRLRD